MKYKTPCLALCSSLLLSALPGVAQDKPNILVIWSDDVGQFLKILDELGIAEKTIVHYSTDNGPHYNTWPDAAATPFRGEKNTNWQGGWRVPCVVRWPGVVQPGSVSNGIVHQMEWLTTFLTAAGKTDIKTDPLDGYSTASI